MFTVLRNELTHYVVSALAKTDGEAWERKMRDALRRDDTYYGSGSGSSNLDVAALLLLITIRMQDCFAPTYRLGHGPRGYVSELRELRNKWAHQVEFDDAAASRAIETAKLLLEAFGCTNVQELIEIRNEIVAPVAPARARKRLDGSAIASPSKSAVTQTDYAQRLSAHVGEEVVGKTRTVVETVTGSTRICIVYSKDHAKDFPSAIGEKYWYTIHERQIDEIIQADDPYIAFVCGSAAQILLIPVADFMSWLEYLNPNTKGDVGWHVHLTKENRNWDLLRKGRMAPIDVTRFLIVDHKSTER